MTNTITITKSGSSYSVNIDAEEITENYDKYLSFIRPGTTKQKQADGPKTVKVVDLLRITHTIVIRGRLVPTATKSADDVKSDLINLIKGGGVPGVACTVTYSSHPDSPLSMFIEKCMIIEKPMDYDPSANETDLAKYEVQITLSEGISI